MTFRDQVRAISGEDVNLCFQCSKCSNGCPLGDRMDLKPAQVMHGVRLNQEAMVLHSRAIWLCVACETCTSRCPQGVSPVEVMTAARVIALRNGIQPGVKEVGIYYHGFLDNMRLNGKIHDASVAGITQLMTGQLRSSLPLAWKLLIRGRVKPPPLPLGWSKYRKLHKETLEFEQTREAVQ